MDAAVPVLHPEERCLNGLVRLQFYIAREAGISVGPFFWDTASALEEVNEKVAKSLGRSPCSLRERQ